MKKGAADRRFDALFAVLALAAAVLSAFLLYRVSLQPAMGENFDITIHNNIASEIFSADKLYYQRFYHVYKYPLYHILVNIFGRLAGGNFTLAGALVMGAANGCTVAAMRSLMLRITGNDNKKTVITVDIVSFALIFIGPLVGCLTGGYFYKYVSSPNIWHNPTYLAARPLGLYSVCFFTDALADFRAGHSYKKNIVLFSLFCLLAAAAKPSYSFFILPAMGLYTLIFVLRAFKKRRAFGIWLLAAVIPVGALLLWQSLSIFGDGNAISTVVRFGGYGRLSLGGVLKATLAVSPLCVLCFIGGGWRQLFRSPLYTLAWLGFVFGWAEMFFLDIQSPMLTESSGDFTWQYSLAVNLFTAVSCGYIIKYIFAGKSRYRLLTAAAAAALLIWQLYCGVQYLVYFITGAGVYFI